MVHLQDLGDALEAHLRMDPPRRRVLQGDTDLAVVDALLVGVATSVIEHDGRVPPEALTTVVRNVLDLELAVAESRCGAHPYVESLMRVARIMEEWFVEGLR